MLFSQAPSRQDLILLSGDISQGQAIQTNTETVSHLQCQFLVKMLGHLFSPENLIMSHNESTLSASSHLLHAIPATLIPSRLLFLECHWHLPCNPTQREE